MDSLSGVDKVAGGGGAQGPSNTLEQPPPVPPRGAVNFEGLASPITLQNFGRNLTASEQESQVDSMDWQMPEGGSRGQTTPDAPSGQPEKAPAPRGSPPHQEAAGEAGTNAQTEPIDTLVRGAEHLELQSPNTKRSVSKESSPEQTDAETGRAHDAPPIAREPPEKRSRPDTPNIQPTQPTSTDSGETNRMSESEATGNDVNTWNERASDRAQEGAQEATGHRMTTRSQTRAGASASNAAPTSEGRDGDASAGDVHSLTRYINCA